MILRKYKKGLVLVVLNLLAITLVFSQTDDAELLPKDTLITVKYKFHESEPPQRLQVMIRGDKAFLNDDVVLGDAATFLNKNKRSAVINGNHRRWPDNTMPYFLPSDHPERAAIRQAITLFGARTNVKFVERTSQTNFVAFESDDDGCYSNIGMIGGRQVINMSGNCGVAAGIHEIGHAVGLFHEQARQDRDEYVNIIWGNISDGKEHNFQTYVRNGNQGTDFDIYDYASIMHYGTHSFSKNNNPTITIKTPPAKQGTVIGRGTNLSKVDILAVNAMYRLFPFGDEELVLNDELGIPMNPLCSQQSFDMEVGVKNISAETITGKLQLFLHENRTGELLDSISPALDFEIASNSVLEKIVFPITLGQLDEGRYHLGLWTVDDAGKAQKFIGDGNFENGKLIQSIEDCESVQKDRYEFNDTENHAYPFDLSFMDSIATITTDSADIHTLGDIDYYQFNLEANKNYFIESEIIDSENKPFGSTVSNDVTIAYRNQDETWESTQDEKLLRRQVLNGGSHIFRIKSHFPDEKGTYDLTWKIEVDTDAMLKLNQKKLTLEPSDTLIELQIASNRDWQLTEEVDWINPPLGQGFGFDTISIRLSPNEGFEDRSTIVYFTIPNDTLQQEVEIIHKGRTRILQGEIASIPLCFNTREAIIFVEANTHWQATSDANWISILEQSTDTGDGYLRIKAIRNITGEDRNGRILLETTDFTNEINFSQSTNEGIEACINPVYMELGKEAGEVDITISSSTDWTVTNSNEWINLNSFSGDGDGSLVASYESLDPNDSLRIGRMDLDFENFGKLSVLLKQSENNPISSTPSLSTELSSVQLFPNPVRDKLQLQFHLAKAQNIELEVYNLLGQKVKNIPVPSNRNGIHIMELDTSDLSSGQYLLALKGASFMIGKKFVVIP